MKRLNLTFDTNNHLEYDLLYNKVDVKGWLNKWIHITEYYDGLEPLQYLTHEIHFEKKSYFKMWDDHPPFRQVPQSKFYALKDAEFVSRYPNKGVFLFGKNV